MSRSRLDEGCSPAHRLVMVKIHGMPCVNRCLHCYENGSPGRPMMDLDGISFVLEKVSALGRSVDDVRVLMFEEPTVHPSFVEIMQMQGRLGLIREESFFLPTNGYGLARLDPDGWESLVGCGVSWLQLTFYGTGEGHDAFAGRRGAFDDLARTIRSADEHGMKWYAGVMIHSGNVHDYACTADTISSLGTPAKPVGWFTMGWQGRGADGRLRIRAGDLALLPDRRGLWRTEGEIVGEILDDPGECSRKAIQDTCGMTYLEVAHDLSVFYGGACDSDPFWACRGRVGLGKLDESGFDGILARLDSDPPEPVRLLGEVTCGELAERYGDPRGAMIFHRGDLIRHKWASEYLRETLGDPGSARP